MCSAERIAIKRLSLSAQDTSGTDLFSDSLLASDLPQLCSFLSENLGAAMQDEGGFHVAKTLECSTQMQKVDLCLSLMGGS